MAWGTGNDKPGEAKIRKRIVAGAAVAIVVLLAVFHPWTARPVPVRGARGHPRAGDGAAFADKHDPPAGFGMPFPQPPVGALRWRAPQSLPRWRDTRQALAMSPV